MNTRPVRQVATLQSVAREAQVHVSTAATILNNAGGNTRVSPETRQRVIDVAARLGYRPNRLAQNLRRQRSMTIGLVAGSVENPFFARMATLCEGFLLEKGYELVMAMDAGRYRNERAVLEMLLSRGVDGVLFWNMGETEGRRYIEQGVDCPVVMCGYPSSKVDSVTVDFRLGARMAVEHLVDAGRRRIAYFCPDESVATWTGEERHIGYVQTMEEHGLEPIVVSYESTLSDISRAREAAEGLGRAGNPTDALFCFNDLAAIGAMMGLRRAGLSVPRDVSLVGFDDIPMASQLDVPLTTIDMPLLDLCEAAIRLLLQQLGGDTMNAGEGPQTIRLTPRLVVRASTAT